MKIVSLILARGGSKAIPKKNITLVNGKPLIQYVIEASKQSSVNETWVSSDCPEIRNVSENLGAYTIRRPDDISQADGH